jgi:DNA-binding CsgD family transcriptional regulator
MTQSLSNREREIAEQLLEGKSNKMIAQTLGITERTVEFHLKNIYEKYQVNSRVELILLLGNATGKSGAEKLGDSTVETANQRGENNAMSNSQKDWSGSFRKFLSNIGKEIKMNVAANSNASQEGRMMPFFESIRVCLSKYAEFTGRATRPEFWWFMLFVTLVTSALEYVSKTAGTIFLIAMLLPLLAVGARRLNDIGKSPWYQLFLLAPVGGLVMLAFLWARPSTDPQPGADPAV